MALTKVSRGLLSTSIVDNGNATAITIDSSENVGVGTSSPNQKLEVDGAVKVTNFFTNETSTNSGYFDFVPSTSTARITIKGNDGSTLGKFQILQQASDGNPSSASFYIDANSNVGIGTSSPSEDLTIAGTKSGNSVTDAIVDFGIRNSNGDSKKAQIKSIGTADTSSQLIFSTTASHSFEERMRIDSSGATLINTTFKSNSGTRLGVFADSGAVAIETRCKTNVFYYPLANYSAAGSYIGGINASTTATSLATSSDQRLKENIADADDAGSKIDAIQVRKYDWKVDGSHQDYGMVAQELREIIPNVIHESPDEEKMLSVDYAGLVPMLIKEIQSLRNRVAQLEE